MTTQPQTVTIAQAIASTASGLLVVDTAAHIVAALPNAGLAARIASVTFAAPAALTAAQMSLLFPLAAKLHPQPGFLALLGANVCTVAQLGAYEALPDFTVASGGSITLSDTTAQIVGMLSAHPAWFAQVAAVTIHLDGTTIGAYPAYQINSLITHGKPVVFVQSGNYTTLNVAAAAHDLATNAASLNALATHVGLTISVTNDGAALSAADATSLVGLQGFHIGAHTLFVSDTGANIGPHLTALLGQGYAQIQVVSGTLAGTASQLLDPSIHYASGAHAQLSASATVGASTAASIAALPGYAAASGAVLTVSDTAMNLLSNTASWVGAAGAVSLAGDATLSAASAQTLGQIATRFGAGFTLAGHSLTVSDTLAAIEALPASVTSLATGIALTANASVSAAQFAALQAFANVNLAGHTVAVSDTAPALLALSGSNLSQATSISLSADATVSVAQIQALAAEPGFSTAGHSLVVADTAANLLALPQASLALASAIELSADATLSAAAAQILTSKAGYVADTHALTIADTAATLASLTAPVVAFAATEQVTVSATISAATATALANLPHLVEAAGVSLTIQDTMAGLLALGGPALAVASAVHLVPGSITSTDAAHAAALAAIPGFSASGATLNVTDTLADLNASATAGWSSVATTHTVFDTAATLLAAAGSPLLTSASAVALSGPATVSAANATTLAGMPDFTGGAELTVDDTTAALLANAPALAALGCAVNVTDSATVTVAGVASLVQIQAASSHFSLGFQNLTVSDTAANLAGLTHAETTLASSVALSGDATVTAAQFAFLSTLPNMSLGGHLLTVSDTATNLVGLTSHFALISTASLSANATVSAATFNALSSLPQFTSAGHVLTVSDTAANLVGIAATNLSQVTSTALSADALVNAQQAQALATEPGFTTGGHSLTVSDTLAAIEALPASVTSLATGIALTANASVSAAQFAALQAFANVNLAGHTVAVSDTAPALLALSGSNLSQATSISLSADATVSVAQIQALAAEPGFSTADHSLVVADTAANLLALPQASLALASAIELSADATLSAAAAQILTSKAGYVADTHALTIADTAATLASLTAPVVAFAATEQVTVSATISAATATALANLPHLVEAAGVSLTIQDTMAGLLALGGPALAVASAVHLVPGSITSTDAAHAAALAAIPGFSASGATLNVTDTLADLNASATAGWSSVATTHAIIDSAASIVAAAGSPVLTSASSVALPAPATISAADATTLAGMPNFISAPQVTVGDTTAALIANAPALAALGCAVNVTDSATVTVAGVASLVQIQAASSHFSLGFQNLTVSDTAANLAGLTHAETTLASSVALSGDATVTAAQFAFLSTLPNMSLGGHLLTVSDTATNLVGLTSHFALISTASLSANATVSAATFNALSSLPQFTSAGHVLTVSDTAANLVGIAATNLSQVTSTALSADALVNAQQAQALATEPGFTTGGHQLVISDSPASLLALPHSLLVASSELMLSSDQAVSASVLTQLAALGIKFNEAGHILTCVDTATNLAALSPSATALAGGEVLGSAAIVNAATAGALALLPALSAQSGATLTIQDNVANILALGLGAPALVSSETLAPGSVVTITASQAIALSNLPRFSTTGATITVTDTVAALNAAGTSVLQTIASATDVIDTANNLATNSSSSLLQNADSVTLVGNAQVTAAVAAQLATIPHFTTGSYLLTVADTAANMAQHVSAIVALGAHALVTDSGPVTVAVADNLATISAGGTLSFQGGNQLLVQDNFAALTAANNAPGLALAARIGVLDTATDLVLASAHNWGALNPTYTLSQGGVISATVATSLASLGSHFSSGGFAFNVSDNAANVVGVAAALNVLSITASVNDTASDIDAQAANLVSMGGAIAHVTFTDTSAVSAATAAGLATLSSLISGSALLVMDTANGVFAQLAQLQTLGSHVATIVQDSAVDVGAHAAALATLGTNATVALTDLVPVTASAMVALAPVISQLAPGTQLAVNDAGTIIAANATALSALSAYIGAITLSDGSTLSAVTAAAIAPLDGHFAPGLLFTVTGTAAAVAAAQAGLTTLQADGHLAAVNIFGASVADVIAHLGAVNALSATVSISDTSADVDGALSSLSQINHLQSISLSDAGTPALSMNIETLATNLATIEKVNAPFTLAISDTAADISTDLASGAASTILNNRANISQVIATDGGTVTLTQSQALAAGVNDGPSSALAQFSGSVEVTNVDLAHLTQIASGTHVATEIDVVDTAANVSADLALGSSSLLLTNSSYVHHVDATSSGTIILTQQQALVSGVADSAQSILGKTSYTQFAITSATISGLSQIAGLTQQPISISVDDTAADISADLATSSSALVAGLPTLAAVAVSDNQPILLTEAEVRASHVDDGPGSVLSKIIGPQLTVTSVAAADLSTVLGLSIAPTHVSLTDGAGAILTNLSTIVADIGSISAINVTGGTALTLTASEALSSHVDDGLGSLVDRLAGHAFQVTGSSVVQLSALSMLSDAPTSITVSDTSNNIATDLTSGHSILAAQLGLIDHINVVGGQLSLTDAQADTILGSPSFDNVFTKLASATQVTVTGAPVSDIASLASSGWPNVSIGVADTVAHISADLASGMSALSTHSAICSSVTLTGSGTVNASTLAGMAALTGFSTNGYSLTLQDSAQNVLSLTTQTLALAQSVQISDTDNHVASSLDSLQATLGGHVTITLTGSSPSISATASQYAADQATIDAVTNPAVFNITGSASDISGLASILSADSAVGQVTVTDTASNVVASMSALQQAGAKLNVALTDSSITANLVVPLLGVTSLSPPGLPVVDTGSQIAALVESGSAGVVNFLNTNGATLSGDSAVTAADAAALETLTNFSKGGHTLNVWDTAQHLASSTYSAALSGAVINGIFLKAPGNAVTVTAAQAAALFAIPGFATTNPDGSQNTVTVSDTALHLDTNIAVLRTNIQSIAAVDVTGAATISDQVLTDLQSIGAVATGGASLVVRDTATAIASNAITQTSSGVTITPVAWTLSGDGTVSEASAAVLGALAGFNPGAYRISLGLSNDLTISVSDANKLGNIASALDLSGHHLVVSGSVTQLSSLSSAALQIVTPALIDTASDVSALPTTSGLLKGTVEITGSDPLNAASCSALFNLIQSGGTVGIAPSALSFDHVHAVTDTVTNLEQLTTSAGWMATNSLHSSIHLVVADTVDNLISNDNRSFLAGVYGSTLQGDVSISASNAESLSTAAAAIHFNRDTSHINVLDSASALLSSANAGGIAFADSVQLAGPEHVDAADAETLLGLSQFHLTTALTIEDNSTALLDPSGGLEQAITNSVSSDISVQLAAPETLDADTAESLVSLTGFSDMHNLTVADDPSYLLNSANLSAEQMAVQVTLASDETVSANTVLRLSAIPHFTAGSSHLYLASNDFADAGTLKAIADMGSAFQPNGNSLTMTADTLSLTPTEYTALQADDVNKNGHMLGILPTDVSVIDTGNTLTVSGHGLSGDLVKVYGAAGSLQSSTIAATESFSVTTADAGSGQNFTVTSTAPSGGNEGAPVIILDTATIESAVSNAGLSFAASGQVEVDVGKFLNIYTAGTVPNSTYPSLVYDPSAHAVALDLPSHSSLSLVTLGGTTHPATLIASEFLFKVHG